MISVLVSHIPFVPIPAPCLDSSIHIPKILGPMCLMAASSICNFASALFACLSKILRMRSTLSRTLSSCFLSFSPTLYICAGFRILPMISRSAHASFISTMISSSFPDQT